MAEKGQMSVTEENTVVDPSSTMNDMASLKRFAERQENINAHQNEQISAVLTSLTSIQQMLAGNPLSNRSNLVHDPVNVNVSNVPSNNDHAANQASFGGTSGPPLASNNVNNVAGDAVLDLGALSSAIQDIKRNQLETAQQLSTLSRGVTGTGAIQTQRPMESGRVKQLMQKNMWREDPPTWADAQWEKALKHFPRFNPAEGTFSDFVINITNHLQNFQVPLNPEVRYVPALASAVFFNMDHRARAKAAQASPQEARNAEPNLSFPDYLQKLMFVFESPAASYEARHLYLQRKQQSNEPIETYLAAKRSLYIRAYPNNHGDSGDFASFREEVLKGVAHPGVRAAALAAVCISWEQLEAKIKTETAVEQMKLRLNCSTYSEDRGLHVDRIYDGTSATTQRGVNQLSFEQEEAVVGAVTPQGQGRGRPQKRVCYDCGSEEHFINSPMCTDKGARKYAPQHWKNNRGRRNFRGGRRGGFRGGRQGSVNQVVEEAEEEEEESNQLMLTHEPSFLGGGQAQTQGTNKP